MNYIHKFAFISLVYPSILTITFGQNCQITCQTLCSLIYLFRVGHGGRNFSVAVRICRIDLLACFYRPAS